MVTFLAALLLFGTFAFAQDNINPQAAALQDFEKRVSDYLSLEKRLSKGNPVNKPTDEPHVILERQLELAKKIREARRDAKQGDIFTPPISQEFRRLLRLALAGQHDADVKKSLARSEPVHVSLHINEAYPDAVPRQSTPPTILLNVPRLPPELEYLIDGHALAIHDIAANLVVDLIPDAIP